MENHIVYTLIALFTYDCLKHVLKAIGNTIVDYINQQREPKIPRNMDELLSND